MRTRSRRDVTTPAASRPGTTSDAIASPDGNVDVVVDEKSVYDEESKTIHDHARTEAIPRDSSCTSSIHGLTVLQVRSSLSVLRQQWADHSPVVSMHLSTILPCNMTTSAFAYHFIMGHHTKRNRRCESCIG